MIGDDQHPPNSDIYGDDLGMLSVYGNGAKPHWPYTSRNISDTLNPPSRSEETPDDSPVRGAKNGCPCRKMGTPNHGFSMGFPWVVFSNHFDDSEDF